MLNYLVPNDARTLVEHNIGACQNLSLIMARYIPKEAIDKANVPDQRNKKWHEVWLKERLAGLKVPPELVTGQYARWDAKTKGAARFKRRLSSRMIIGLGGKGPLEIGITLDYITGLPTIPGSALKGLARTYALYAIAEQFGVPVLTEPAASEYHGRGRQDGKRKTPLDLLNEWLAAPDAEKNGARARAEALHELTIAVGDAIQCGTPVMAVFDPIGLEASPDAVLFRLAFGSNAQSGFAVFHEAVVSAAGTSGKLFELDVMTVHFKKYYDDANGSSGPNRPPADDDSPNPINFITVAEGTEFEFAVGVRRNAAGARILREEFYRLLGAEVDNLPDDQLFNEVVRAARKWLLSAVGVFGVGGKTAAGYGYFVKP
ncbi:MAG: type III-B CRISPR module RAMP protein Cmr6 [Anaerolineae bacterium]|nr:type III-B CRISPR module RAMP protein Cmr6 [Anaerolineae bacterium]